MRFIAILIAFISTLLSISTARADVTLRIVDAGSLELPTRDGNKVKVGPPVVAPFTVTRASATGARVDVEVGEATARALADATAANRGRQLAIVVDGTVESTPTIREPIRDGKVKLTFKTPAEAKQLANALTHK